MGCGLGEVWGRTAPWVERQEGAGRASAPGRWWEEGLFGRPSYAAEGAQAVYGVAAGSMWVERRCSEPAWGVAGCTRLQGGWGAQQLRRRALCVGVGVRVRAQVQKLLGRLIACVPEGAAQSNEIVLQSCIMVRARAVQWGRGGHAWAHSAQHTQRARGSAACAVGRNRQSPARGTGPASLLAGGEATKYARRCRAAAGRRAWCPTEPGTPREGCHRPGHARHGPSGRLARCCACTCSRWAPFGPSATSLVGGSLGGLEGASAARALAAAASRREPGPRRACHDQPPRGVRAPPGPGTRPTAAARQPCTALFAPWPPAPRRHARRAVPVRPHVPATAWLTRGRARCAGAAQVLRELRAVYRAVCEGIINLADKFFEMERPDALKALDIYRCALGAACAQPSPSPPSQRDRARLLGARRARDLTLGQGHTCCGVCATRRDNIALNEKLNASLSAVNNVPALRGTVQMPALQVRPALLSPLGADRGRRTSRRPSLPRALWRF